MSLTPEQTAKYMTHLGLRCPYCNSMDIGSVTFRPKHVPHAEHLIYETVKCCDCDKSWVETYTLSYVETPEDFHGENYEE